MDQEAKEFVLNILDTAKDLTLATTRPDGYPQATTVSYANDGLSIFVGVGQDSQKITNIRYNNKISLTINAEYHNWNQIKGISLAGVAEILTDSAEIGRATGCMIKRFPQVIEWLDSGQARDVVFLKITPYVISLLNYEKGFGHAELVTVES